MSGDKTRYRNLENHFPGVYDPDQMIFASFFLYSSDDDRRTLPDIRESKTGDGGKIMIVSMWMARDLITINPETTVTEAATIMAAKHIRRLPIVENKGMINHPIGIITATDILHAHPPHVNPFTINVPDNPSSHITAGEIMSRNLQTIAPETPVEEAAQIMCSQKISTLLVIQKGRLTGLITESDIFRAFVGILDYPHAGVRITFELFKGEDFFRLIAPAALKWNVQITGLVSVQQGERRLCMVRATGSAVNKMLEDIWKSGHSVLNIIRIP